MELVCISLAPPERLGPRTLLLVNAENIFNGRDANIV